MKKIAILVALVVMAGCSVNVIVAPDATVAVESNLTSMQKACQAQPNLLICNWHSQ